MKTVKDLVFLTCLMAGVLAFSYFMAVMLSNKPVDNSVGMKFIKVSPGSFKMGSPENEDGRYNRETSHWVTITKDYYIQTTEVTQAQWIAVMGTKPWDGRNNVKVGDNFPATYVSWDDCKEFVKKLNEKEKTDRYRLPTEAEWEYACRAGSKGPYGFSGTALDLDKYGWFNENTVKINENYPHKVGLKKPNKLGLYDMHGNVWELVQDWYGEELPEGTDPVGPESGAYRVTRGGGWTNAPKHCTSEARTRIEPDDDFPETGFRLVFMPD